MAHLHPSKTLQSYLWPSDSQLSPQRVRLILPPPLVAELDALEEAEARHRELLVCVGVNARSDFDARLFYGNIFCCNKLSSDDMMGRREDQGKLTR